MAIAISQEAFDAMVRENMEYLGGSEWTPTRPSPNAVDALSLQGADLSGIIKRVPGEADAAEVTQVSPVMRVLDELKASASASGRSEEDLDKLVSLLDELRDLRCGEGSEDAAVAVRNGGVEALVALCASARVKQERLLASALKALSSVLRDSAFDSPRIHFSENLKLSAEDIWLVDWLQKSYEGELETNRPCYPWL